MAEENQHLPEHPLLARINRVRERLGDTDRTDHLQQLDEWERKVKKSLIFLNLKGHEGIDMMIERAKEEIRDRNHSLKTRRPTDLSDDGLRKFVAERSFDFMAIDLWMWFLTLFVESESSIIDIEGQLSAEEDPTEEEYKGSDGSASTEE